MVHEATFEEVACLDTASLLSDETAKYKWEKARHGLGEAED
jgi:hypothetical protein